MMKKYYAAMETRPVFASHPTNAIRSLSKRARSPLAIRAFRFWSHDLSMPPISSTAFRKDYCGIIYFGFSDISFRFLLPGR